MFDFQDRHLGGAFGAAVLSHLALVVLAFLILRYAPRPQIAAILPEQLP